MILLRIVFSVVLVGVVIVLLDIGILKIKHIWLLYILFCIVSLYIIYMHRGLALI